MQTILKKAINSAIIVIKYVIPIYIIADLLFFYNTLSYISFLLEPFTSFLGLPKESALAIISGMFLNLYAAIAFAAPLDLDAQQWTILAIFLGVCHSLIVESAIIKRLGISVIYSYSLRFFGGLLIAYSATFIPKSFFTNSNVHSGVSNNHYDSLAQLLINSFYNASILAFKIIILITLLIFLMEFIKNMPFFKKHKNISRNFSLGVGLLLGITYGAGILMQEVNNINKKDLFFIATFLNITHAIIEDPLLFVLFGANIYVIISVRVVWGVVLAYFLTAIYRRFYEKNNLQ
jgi:hypothetical protein